MDGLALLCNLFADGPVTLKRLRIAGVATLDELERAAPTRLAEWLHASLPQARAFAEEARKLAERLAEGAGMAALRDVDATPQREVVSAEPVFVTAVAARLDGAARAPAAPSGAQSLRPGLLPGLDEALCARLAIHHVRTVQALREFSGLALARRTGIPYSTLLELARHARRFGAGRAEESRAPLAPFATGERAAEGLRERRSAAVRSIELVPFTRAKRAPAETELARTDEFTLPMAEPDSAGPFG